MTTLVRAIQDKWLGGINSAGSDDSLEINESRDLINITLTNRPDSLEQISGTKFFVSIGGTPDAPNIEAEKIFRFYKSSGAAFTMISWVDNTVRKVGHINVSGETILTTPSVLVNAITDWAAFQDKVYFVNGTNKLYSWDGIAAGFVEVTFPISFAPKVIEMFNNRAYYAGDTAEPLRFIHSQPLTPDVFDSPFLDFFDVSGVDGDAIEDLQLLGANMIVLAQRSLHTVVGSPPQRIDPNASLGIGCINRDTTQKTPVGIIFLSMDGVYLFQGRQPIKLSRKIDNDIRKVIDEAGGSFESAFHRGEYTLFFKTLLTAFNNDAFTFSLNTLDLETQNIGVTKRRDFRIGDSTIFSGAADKEEWFGIQHKTSNVLRIDNVNRKSFYFDTNNPDQLLTSEILTRFEEFGNKSIEKELRTLYLYHHSAIKNLNVTLITELDGQITETKIVELGSDNPLWDQVNWDEFDWAPITQNFTKIILPDSIYCNRASIKLFSDDPGEFLSLDGYEYHYLLMREI